MKFVWDAAKETTNRHRHGVAFSEAVAAFDDPARIILPDVKHSMGEPRFYCIGQVDGRVITVRFTLRGESIRIIGAAHWRYFRKLYENQNR